jgi:hypothetical protein
MPTEEESRERMRSATSRPSLAAEANADDDANSSSDDAERFSAHRGKNGDDGR